MSYIHSTSFSQTQLTVYSLHHIFFKRLNRSCFNQTNATILGAPLQSPRWGGHFRDFMKVVENVRKVLGVGCCPQARGIKGFGDVRGYTRIWGLFLPIFEYSMEKMILKWFVCFGFGSKTRLVCIARSFLLGPLLGSGTVTKLDIGPYPALPPTVRTNDINVFTTAQTKVLTQKPRKFGFWFCV